MTPNYRTQAWLSALGWKADIVERRRGPTSKDLFGLFDVVALAPDREPISGVLGIQCTTSAHLRERIRKMLGQSALAWWLRRGNGAWAVGWKETASSRGVGSNGRRRVLWQPKIWCFGLWEDRVEVGRLLPGSEES